MSCPHDLAGRVKHALRLLDWLTAEAPALDPTSIALRLDEVRDVLLPAAAVPGEPTEPPYG